MGGNVSAMPPTPPDFPYFSVTFRIYDKMKLINADVQTIDSFRQSIQQYWPGGIQREEVEHGGIHSFKFTGNPFSRTTGKDTAIAVRRLCCVLVGTTRQMGWQLIASCDLSRTQDLTTWFFQRNAAVISQALSPHPIVCVSISSYDKLQMVNAPSNMFQVLKDAVGPGMLQDEEVVSGTDFQVKINGYPWQNRSLEQGLTARRIILEIFRRFDSYRYQYLGSANVKGTADALFFQQDDEMAPGQTQYAILSLNSNDRLRLIDLPAHINAVVEGCVTAHWPRGLQESISHPTLGCQEFKLRGYPWHAYGDDAAAARLLMTTILQALLANGWAVHCALDISRNVNDKGIFVLRSCTPTSLPHFCLAPTDSDRIRVINAPQDVVNTLNTVIQQQWTSGQGVQSHHAVFGGYEWKLSGYAWHPYGGNDWAMARNMVAVCLQQLAAMGWRLVCSCDVSSKYYSGGNNNSNEYPLDVHAMFFVQTGTGAAAAASAIPTMYGMEKSAFGGDAPPPSYTEVMNS